MTSTSSKFLMLAMFSLTAVGCQNSQVQQAREWKALNDTIAECSKKISNLVGVIQQSPHTTEETQKALFSEDAATNGQ